MFFATFNTSAGLEFYLLQI